MRGRRKGIVHGNLHVVLGAQGPDLKEVEFCRKQTAP
jgi:hypothetical protein